MVERLLSLEEAIATRVPLHLPAMEVVVSRYGQRRRTAAYGRRASFQVRPSRD